MYIWLYKDDLIGRIIFEDHPITTPLLVGREKKKKKKKIRRGKAYTYAYTRARDSREGKLHLLAH